MKDLVIRHASRTHWGFVAAMLHRLSGLALAIFLPLHFLALGLALDRARFAGFIDWSGNGFVKFTEFVLVAALALHMAGGLRLLAIEFLQRPPLSATWIAAAIAFGLGAGVLFLLNAFG